MRSTVVIGVLVFCFHMEDIDRKCTVGKVWFLGRFNMLLETTTSVIKYDFG